MAISVEDLIAQKDEIKKRKQQEFDLETSIGVITVKKPTRTIVLESLDMQDSKDNDRYLLYHTIVAPDLSNKKLQQAYGCGEPLDIIDLIFQPGEVVALSKKVMQLAGYGQDIKSTVHEELKN